MADDFETSGLVGLGVSAALSSEYARDQRDFLPLVAGIFKRALPNQVDVIQTGLFKKTIRGVRFIDGENVLVLEDSGRGPLQASFTRVVKGIALKTEPLSVEEWLALVSESLERAMKGNSEARGALAKALGLP